MAGAAWDEGMGMPPNALPIACPIGLLATGDASGPLVPNAGGITPVFCGEYDGGDSIEWPAGGMQRGREVGGGAAPTASSYADETAAAGCTPARMNAAPIGVTGWRAITCGLLRPATTASHKRPMRAFDAPVSGVCCTL